MIITKHKFGERYEVEGELGSGAFGVAYLARDRRMHSQKVVIKLLREANVREIKALTLISHPHVVRVSEQGWTSEGYPFFVMQYVEGRRLRDVIQDGGMELGRAARIIRQLGSALSAVHDKGVIHRDLKPENVMLQTSGNDEFAVIIDFGVATVKESQAGRPEQETWAGTPFYMAPEQLRGRPVPASDVWALGVVAYEMVTGRKPFAAADVLALAETPRAAAFTKPNELRPELPEAAQDVILKALDYDPALRYAHAHEMGDAFLRAVLEAPTLTPEVSSDPRPQTPPHAAASLTELLQRCRELFEPLDEFRRPDVLRDYLNNKGLKAGMRCVRNAEDVDFDRLLFCLSSSGREYPGQLLIDLLASLASRYSGQWQEQEFEGLRSSLTQLFARTHK